jgi:hypothetical protein
MTIAILLVVFLHVGLYKMICGESSSVLRWPWSQDSATQGKVRV